MPNFFARVKNMKRKSFMQRFLACSLSVMLFCAGSLPAAAEENQISAENTQETSDTSLPELSHVCVHDPSIFMDQDGAFYVLGSHTASASSEDMIKWKQLNADYSSSKNIPFYGNLQETLEKPFTWAGYDDGDCSGGYAIWAPDIIWNPYYEWEDGSTGAYMLYCCTSSTWRRSCISYLVSKTFEGPYSFGNTIVYSGFTTTGETDGNSERSTRWDNDYLNLSELMKKGSANGGIDEISDNWFMKDGSWNHNYAPNAIDPNLFFDADGNRLYMSYGSWSGGIYLLELDVRTGDALYPGTDFVDEVSGNYVDRYFGIHLAGGNHQSGEGPYIEYDPESGYYYLYETYGGLQAAGGYNMRLFRSENPSGPYLDAKGGNAAENGANNDNYGIKLIGNYSFYDQIGKRAAGHNSALIDEAGNHYLVYHQRFDIYPQLEGHEVRVHQQFLNEDQWPVTAVYEYRGETPSHYEDSEVIGSYEYINHGTGTTGEMLETQLLTLEEDGTLNGAVNGTWTKTDSGKGYDYLTLTLDNSVTYKGIFFRQHKEDAAATEAMTFTAIGNDNTCIWGSMADLTDETMVVGMAAATLKNLIPEAVYENLTLPTELMGTSIAWSSDKEDILTNDGSFTAPEEDAKVILTADVTAGDTTVTETYKLRAKRKAALTYAFDFEAADENGNMAPLDGSSGTESAILIGSASIVEDAERGNVVEITNEAGASGVNYVALPSDTFAASANSGFTVSMWVKIGAETFEHSALFEADTSNNYPMTRIGANLISRINAGAYSDVTDSMLRTTGERDVWQHIAYTADPYGIKVYLNGERIGQEDKELTECFKKKNTGLPMTTDVKLGSGNIWGDEDCQNVRFDDVRIYNGALPAGEIRALFEAE